MAVRVNPPSNPTVSSISEVIASQRGLVAYFERMLLEHPQRVLKLEGVVAAARKKLVDEHLEFHELPAKLARARQELQSAEVALAALKDAPAVRKFESAKDKMLKLMSRVSPEEMEELRKMLSVDSSSSEDDQGSSVAGDDSTDVSDPA